MADLNSSLYDFVFFLGCFFFLVCLRADVASRRYLDRHPVCHTYQQHQYILQANARFPGIDSTHKQLFRVTTSEFRRLVRLFGDDEVFVPRGRKPMAPAKLQLAVLLHRMAHGHSVAQIGLFFHLPGGLPFHPSAHLIK